MRSSLCVLAVPVSLFLFSCGGSPAPQVATGGATNPNYVHKGDGPIPPIPDDIRVEATRRYIEAYETITGESFAPDLEDPGPRLRRNLGLT